MDRQAADEWWMRRALELAAPHRGWVEPNPMVGAVIVREGVSGDGSDDVVLGEGAHRVWGELHAERAALLAADEAGHAVGGSTMYVTLEPCCHHGKQPPCTDALVERGVKRCVVAMGDPDERVSGKGLAILRGAGVTVEVGLLEAEARRLNAGFIKRIERGLPLVRLKWAMTVDGRIATRVDPATGRRDSKWISSPASRQRVHAMRALSDAVVVGPGTAMTDDPKLTARDLPDGFELPPHRKPPVRVVVWPDAKVPLDATLLHDGGPRVLIAHDENVSEPIVRLRRAGAELLPLPRWDRDQDDAEPAHHLDLDPLMRHLVTEHDATHVLVEGGAGLAGSLLRQGLVDRLEVFVGPSLLSDAEALPPLVGSITPLVKDGQTLTLRGVEQLGGDVMLSYDVAG